MAPKFRYILNLTSRILHKLPSIEVCNVDQLRKRGKFKQFRTLQDAGGRLCKHCFPGQVRYRDLKGVNA